MIFTILQFKTMQCNFFYGTFFHKYNIYGKTFCKKNHFTSLKKKSLSNEPCTTHILFGVVGSSPNLPVSCSCKMHWLQLSKGVKPFPTSILDMTLNNQMVRLQPWRFGKNGVPLHCCCSQVNSGSNKTNYMCKKMTYVKLWLLYSNTWNHLTVCKKKLRLV